MTTIRTHHDMDGICSAYFTAFGVPKGRIEIWDGQFGDTTGLKKGDYLCDMRPIQDDFEGTVIDHHGPYGLKHRYKLIYDEKPASHIAWETFKDDIPKSEWWKLAAGVCGDGAPELIPYEVFESCPKLLYPTKTFAGQSKYGTDKKVNVYYYPTYKLLSSPINALLKKGEFEEAIRLITEAKQPKDIIKDSKAIKAKMDIKKNLEDILKSCDIISFRNLNVVIFYSNYRMQGHISSVLEGADGITTLAINSKNGRGSLRGELALYWKERLNKLDYLDIDGHPGFMGCTLKKNPEALIDDLIEMLN